MRARFFWLTVAGLAIVCSTAEIAGAQESPGSTAGERLQVDESPRTGEPGPEIEAAEPADFGDEEFRDSYGSVHESGLEAISAKVSYVLERIEVVGNERTRGDVIRGFIPLRKGEYFDPESPEIEATEWRLMGTGWFGSVDLSLKRGSRRGWVVLVVEVKERNTIIIEQLAFGISEGLGGNADRDGDLQPYLGLQLTETNLAGLGIRLSGTTVLSRRQQGVRLSLIDPRRIRNRYAIRFSSFFMNSQEFFGNNPLVSVPCTATPCPDPTSPASAVVRYRRWGFSLGSGRDVTTSFRYAIDWQGDWVLVRDRPEAASEQRGSEVRPIDFAIIDGRSFVSSLRFGFTFDKRDDPGMTSRGWFIRGEALIGTRFLGSDYDFLRLEGTLRRWWRLRNSHVIRLGGFAGMALGDVPFFYLYHVSDMTDLIPSRILEMQLDRRPPPNLLNTAIEVMRTEELALRADITYEVPLLRRNRPRGLRGLNAYFLLGLYSLANLRELGTPGFEGAARIPVDLTFDVGLRFDTRVGVLQLGFSNLLGFIQW